MKWILVLILTLFFCLPVHAFDFATGHYTANNTSSTYICFGTGCGGGTEIDSTADYYTRLVFTPSVVMVKCDAASKAMVMATKDTVTSAYYMTNSGAAITTGITALGAGYFIVGNHTYVNPTATPVCHYLALGDDMRGDFMTFAVSGTGSAQTITTGFPPGVIVVRNSGSGLGGYFWVAAKGGDSTGNMQAGINITGCVTGVTTTTFALGTSASCNPASGTTYGFAIRNGAPSVATGIYAGNAIDHTQNTTLGFQVRAMLDKTYDGATYTMGFRWGGLAGDASFSDNGASAADIFETFLSNGYQIGQNNAVNNNTVNYQWFAIGVPVYTHRTMRSYPLQ